MLSVTVRRTLTIYRAAPSKSLVTATWKPLYRRQQLQLRQQLRPLTMTTKKSVAHTALDEKSASGEFKRVDSVFRNDIVEGGKYEPEAG